MALMTNISTMEEHILLVGKPSTAKTQIQKVIERRQHLTLADKMHLMADSLRNFKEKQCLHKFYNKTDNSFCVYGALGFISGMPKSDLTSSDFTGVLRNYGMDLDESGIVVEIPKEARDMHYPQREVSLFSAIYLLNDGGYSFPEIANYLDEWANNLQG